MVVVIMLLATVPELEVKHLPGTREIAGSHQSITLETGAGERWSVGAETVGVEVKSNHVEYDAKPKLECCP
jgi:hypothetical protein